IAVPFALRVISGPPAWDTLTVAFLGLAFGVALWHVAGVVSGDALFHLGRVQKLYSFGDLHVRSVDEFADGGLHPGYAFPLWHAFLALAAKVGGVGPTQVMLHEPSAIAPVAFAVVRVLLTRTDARSSATALAALFLPAGAALAWLLPLVRETASHSPSTRELERAFAKYASELNVDSLHRYALRPEVISRAGAV